MPQRTIKLLCRACWEKETINTGGICKRCLDHGYTERPRPARTWTRKPKDERPADEVIADAAGELEGEREEVNDEE